MQIALFALALIAASATAYIVGRKHGREDAEASYQRMLLIDPPRRAAGTPTNRNTPPSSVRRPRLRNSRMMR